MLTGVAPSQAPSGSGVVHTSHTVRVVRAVRSHTLDTKSSGMFLEDQSHFHMGVEYTAS